MLEDESLKALLLLACRQRRFGAPSLSWATQCLPGCEAVRLPSSRRHLETGLSKSEGAIGLVYHVGARP